MLLVGGARGRPARARRRSGRHVRERVRAAWIGSPGLVDALLEAGADPRGGARDPLGTPLATAARGSQWHALPGRDHVGVAERLVAAGNPLDPRLLEVADGPLAAWLEERV